MEPSTHDEASPKQALNNKNTVHPMQDDADDEEDEEEGMTCAYSVTDLMDELDSGSDDQVGVNVSDNEADKRAANAERPSSVPKDDTRLPDKSLDKLAVVDEGLVSQLTNRPPPAVLPANDRSGWTTEKLDSLDREVSVSRSDSVKNSDTEVTSEHDYEPITSPCQTVHAINQSSSADDGIYENVQMLNLGDDDDDDDDWDSSEFEDVDVFNDGERTSQSSSTSGGLVLRNKGKPVLPPRNKKSRRSKSSISAEIPSASAVLHKMAVRLGSRSKQEEPEEVEEESMMMEVVLNIDNHPPPQLTEAPQHLTNLQIKRRHIVSSIIESENSYLSSLKRIVQDYEKPLLEIKPQILSRPCIKTIFYKVKNILQCHAMFQIELSETIKLWDAEEKIGNVFNASFSKSIVFDVYSAFVNNFSVAMDTAKKQARSKPAFAEFLKYQLEKSPDKLSLFGLMVKPVQRFPQFILLLQDLLKTTPHDHADRLPLQMALTELENLTLRLNEEKRKSESRHDVKRIMNLLSGRFTLKSNSKRYLIRQDVVVQSMTVNGETTAKTRCLFMLSDQVICASIQRKQTESGLMERYRYKWGVPIQEVEVVQSTSKIRISGRKTTLSKFEPPDPPPADHPHKKDLDDLLHDLPMMEQIEQLVSRLRFKYPMMTVESVHSNIRNLKLHIQQKTDIDQCVLQLSLPTRNSSLRTVYSFQMLSPSQKQDWLLELQLAKLALDSSNNPGWYLPEHNAHFTYKLPLYGAVVSVDTVKHEARLLRRSKKQTKVWLHCATPVLLPSDQLDLGIQHLWVCSGEKTRGQITVVSLHTGQPYIIETFKSPGAVSVCAERIPGQSKEGELLDDTVWISTVDNKIHVYNVVEEKRQGPKVTIDTKDMVVTMCHHDHHIYTGHQKGDLAIYQRGSDGEWEYKTPSILTLGTEPVSSLLLVGSHVWAACGQHIHVIRKKVGHVDKKDADFEQIQHKLAQPEEGSIECMVKAGAGLIVSFRNKAYIRLYHFETLENLQDINMVSVTRSFYEDKPVDTDLKEGLKRLCVTCLLATRGLLWIGTNIGCILTLPLPHLEGVPQIRGRPSVSYHGHVGPVKFLTAIHCGLAEIHPQPLNSEHLTSTVHELHKDDNEEEDSQTLPLADEPATMRDEVGGRVLTLGGALRNRWISTPDLYLGLDEDRLENLNTLYGSLMRGLDDDFEMEIDMHKVKCMSKNVLSNLNAMSNRVTKFSGAMMNRLMQQDQGNKAATLPVLFEDGLGNPCSSSSDNVSSGSHHRDSMTTSGDFSENTDALAAQEAVCVHYENVEIIRQHEHAQLPVNYHHYQNAEMCQDGKLVRSDAVEGTNDKPEDVVKSRVMQAAHVFNKALVILSGGEGYINWNIPKKQTVKSDETSLVMWQIPP